MSLKYEGSMYASIAAKIQAAINRSKDVFVHDGGIYTLRKTEHFIFATKIKVIDSPIYIFKYDSTDNSIRPISNKLPRHKENTRMSRRDETPDYEGEGKSP